AHSRAPDRAAEGFAEEGGDGTFCPQVFAGDFRRDGGIKDKKFGGATFGDHDLLESNELARRRRIPLNEEIPSKQAAPDKTIKEHQYSRLQSARPERSAPKITRFFELGVRRMIARNEIDAAVH